ncbi:MAG: DEAD/DEAH box helicase [bacterium]|jgi:DEAD/DEAH box helicase domain-containing protein
MHPEKLLAEIRQHPSYKGQIKHIEKIPPREARYGSLEVPLHPLLARHLQEQGITNLYSHQAAAVNAVAAGENVVVVTPTASGKTLCYNLPVLNALIQDPAGRALYLFPTKALSRDQLDAVQAFPVPVTAAVYDGDTPDQEKLAIREEAQIVISNPDMLHLGILPNHLKWHSFFSRLRFIVIDELHAYRGVFGTNVAHILRRLRRICSYYGSEPQFILSSATIANPREHAQRLTGVPVTLIDDNGAPQGERHFVLWSPPQNRSYIHDVAWLLALLMKERARTITFSRARQVTERILRLARNSLPGGLAGKLVAYRGGYLARERRQIEQALFTGRLLGVVSTNALELGIDVGELEVCIIAGFPGTIASTWQQAGRVGRRQKDSLVLFIAVANPLDQYFLRHPEVLFTRPTEQALIDPANPYILMGHLPCAAQELPLTDADLALWDDISQDLLLLLAEDGQVINSDDRWYYLGEGYPADRVQIRTAGETFQLRDRGNRNRLVGVIDGQLALSEAHPGAVYMHQGETYLVEDLALEEKCAYLRQVDVDYYTMVKRAKATQILATQARRDFHGNSLGVGTLRVTTQVTGYLRKHEITGQVLGGGDLDLPPQELETVGMWLQVQEDIIAEARSLGLDPMGGLHAIEHAAIALLPLFAMCDRNDIGGLSTLAHDQTQSATIFIHDAYPGGVGFSEAAYRALEDLLAATLEAVQACPCETGCPCCIHSPKCSNFNRPLDKEGAIFILHRLLEREYIPRKRDGRRSILANPNLRRLAAGLGRGRKGQVSWGE